MRDLNTAPIWAGAFLALSSFLGGASLSMPGDPLNKALCVLGFGVVAAVSLAGLAMEVSRGR